MVASSWSFYALSPSKRTFCIDLMFSQGRRLSHNQRSSDVLLSCSRRRFRSGRAPTLPISTATVTASHNPGKISFFRRRALFDLPVTQTTEYSPMTPTREIDRGALCSCKINTTITIVSPVTCRQQQLQKEKLHGRSATFYLLQGVTCARVLDLHLHRRYQARGQ